MFDLVRLGDGFGPWTLPIAAICALLGAAMLSRYLHVQGLLGFVLSFILLLSGALLSNLVGEGMISSYAADLKKPILLSLAGMTVTALITLTVAAGSHNE
jgi:hypothetical protein